jgi:tetratricopeptide (TPR) repeat protein
VQHTCLEYHVGIVPITALANVAKVLATTDSDGAARLTGDAENIAQSITIESLKATALATVAEAMATTDPGRAEQIARAVTDESSMATALANIVKVLIATDPNRGSWLIGDAENIAQSITDESMKITALANVAKVLAATDPDGAARLTGDAENIAQSEAVKAILDGDPTLTPGDLLDRTRDLPEDQVVRVLVGEAYDLLDAPGKQVMQALAVFPAPVSAVGVDFLLQPVNPTTDAAPVLTRLVRRQLARFHDGLYHLHPVDRDYARSQIPAGSPGDAPAAFTLTGLQARAADYYTQIRAPRESWRTLDDLRPQLAEFQLRCDTGDYDTAATVLADIDFDYLLVWGHHRMLMDLHGRIHGRITDPDLNAAHLTSLGACHYSLGDYRQAIDLHTQALAIARDTGNRQGEGRHLGNLGSCHASLGNYPQAIDLYTQALAIDRDLGNRHGEGIRLGNLGSCHARLGNYPQAIDLHTQALAIDRDTGDRQGEGTDLANLGFCHATLGDYRHATGLYTQALAIARDIGDRYNEANTLNYLGRAQLASGDSHQAVTLLEQAVAIADATGDIEPIAEARSGLAQAQLQLGDPAAALAAATARRERPYPAEEPVLRLLEGIAVLELHRSGESVHVFRDALAAADVLAALADTNVAALQARALALAGLAAVTGAPAGAAKPQRLSPRPAL